MRRFNLQRVDIGDRLRTEYKLTGTNANWLGEESRWPLNVPLVYRVLAASRGGLHDFVRAPQRGDDFETDTAFTYWGSLLHLFIFSFGWSSPGLGLRWWLENGRPAEDDDRLALLEQTWFADGQLDWFAAYLWTSPLPVQMFSADSWQDLDLRPSREWIEKIRLEVHSSDILSPFSDGDGDSLHLSSHIINLMAEAPEGLTLTVDAGGEARGVLLADSLAGWYRFLEQSPELSEPHPSGRSWRIDVVVKPVGWLGAFRRSRETGRWFAGPHRHHTVGCMR